MLKLLIPPLIAVRFSKIRKPILQLLLVSHRHKNNFHVRKSLIPPWMKGVSIETLKWRLAPRNHHRLPAEFRTTTPVFDGYCVLPNNRSNANLPIAEAVNEDFSWWRPSTLNPLSELGNQIETTESIPRFLAKFSKLSEIVLKETTILKKRDKIVT